MTDNPNRKQKDTSKEDVAHQEEEKPIDALRILSHVTLATARLAGRAGASDICQELHHHAEQLEKFADQMKSESKTTRFRKE